MAGLFDELRWLKPDVDGEYDGEEGPYLKCNSKINKKIFLYMGESWKLPVDAIVIGQTEQLLDRTECAAIFPLAGPEFEQEIESLGVVETSSSAICTGANLCPYIVVSVGPRYLKKYESAAESSLVSAYRSALLLLTEKVDIKSVALNCIYLKKSQYPRDQAAHIALRAVRRFLEHEVSSNIEKIVFCVPPDDFELYNLLLTAYFPRSAAEAINQVEILPEDIGNAWGEKASVDRTLRVSVGPRPPEGFVPKPIGEPLPRNKIKTGLREFPPSWPRPREMTEVAESVDQERYEKITAEFAMMSKDERLRKRLEFLVEEAEEAELGELAELGFLQQIGRDRAGRVVVLLMAAGLRLEGDPHSEQAREKKERMLIFIVKSLEGLRTSQTPYVLIYCHSGMTPDNSPDPSWVETVFELLTLRYADNLKKFYMLHTSMMLRAYLYINLPFLGTTFWKDYECIDNLKGLNQHIEVRHLQLPPAIQTYDVTTFPGDYWIA